MGAGLGSGGAMPAALGPSVVERVAAGDTGGAQGPR